MPFVKEAHACYKYFPRLFSAPPYSMASVVLRLQTHADRRNKATNHGKHDKDTSELYETNLGVRRSPISFIS
jgi:hypothetical protein